MWGSTQPGQPGTVTTSRGRSGALTKIQHPGSERRWGGLPTAAPRNSALASNTCSLPGMLRGVKKKKACGHICTEKTQSGSRSTGLRRNNTSGDKDAWTTGKREVSLETSKGEQEGRPAANSRSHRRWQDLYRNGGLHLSLKLRTCSEKTEIERWKSLFGPDFILSPGTDDYIPVMLTQTGLDSVIFKRDCTANKQHKKINIGAIPELPTSDALVEPGKNPPPTPSPFSCDRPCDCQTHCQSDTLVWALRLPSSFFIFNFW